MTLREAAQRMEVSYCHAKRLKGVMARDGSRGWFMAIREEGKLMPLMGI